MFSLVFKSGKRAFELRSTMVNIQSLLNSNVTPMRDFNVSKEIGNTQKWSIVLKMNYNVLLKKQNYYYK